MIPNDAARKPTTENRVIFSNRQDYLLRHLICDIASVIGRIGQQTGTVFVLCCDAATEFLLTHELQAMGKLGPIRADRLAVDYAANPNAARVQLLHLLKACNVLVGSWEHTAPILEAPEGPLLSFDMFDVLVIWDAQLVVGSDSYAAFVKKYIADDPENQPRILSFMTCYFDAAEILPTVEAVQTRTVCGGPVLFLTDAEDSSSRVDHPVDLSEDQKDLYKELKEHMQQYEARLQELSATAGTELVAPYPVGTLEYSEWLDAVHLLCYHHGREAPEATEEVNKALALLRRLKQYNVALKLVEETSCSHAMHVLTAAHEEPFSLVGPLPSSAAPADGPSGAEAVYA